MSTTTKKSASTKPAAKKSATKATPSHPSWVEMIKECIVDNPEDSRTGVSRPQIKKYVESKYKLEIGAAQNTQLAKAISTGAEKGTFVLPKGVSGKVKLAPKVKADTSAKENKPASKAKSAAKPKPKTAKTSPAKAKPKTAKAATTKVKPAAKPATKPAAKPAAKATTTKAKTVKKTTAKPTTAPKKKTSSPSKRGAAKKAVTGTTAPKKAAAAKSTKAKTAKSTTSRGRKPKA